MHTSELQLSFTLELYVCRGLEVLISRQGEKQRTLRGSGAHAGLGPLDDTVSEREGSIDGCTAERAIGRS